MNFKIYDVTDWTQIIKIDILPNTQEVNDQSKKSGQLIEYNLRNIFFFKNHAEDEARD